MEHIQNALKSNMAPVQEYLLQGSIVEEQRDILLHRLNGLCDSTDGHPERFEDHEIVMQIGELMAFMKCIILHFIF